MKYFAHLALLAAVLFSSTSNAALDLCRGTFTDYSHWDNKFFFPQGPRATNQICLDLKGEVKYALERDSARVIFLAEKVIADEKITKEWDVDLYGAMQLPEEIDRPIVAGFSSWIRVCSWLPVEFQYVEKSDIIFGVTITRPGSNSARTVICVKGELKLL
ncbi:hypothetical protein BGZ96_009040 [Linnemannia gamsii]|uniref:Uncharacterized protein n=1 Tax=Linnemannia gamsii TaxID=64522 RepID=A0ABQ7KDI0_9FUNG|nr:hypothetical protein BGZ96_009040 [Linnemannia gamsii]